MVGEVEREKVSQYRFDDQLTAIAEILGGEIRIIPQPGSVWHQINGRLKGEPVTVIIHRLKPEENGTEVTTMAEIHWFAGGRENYRGPLNPEIIVVTSKDDKVSEVRFIDCREPKEIITISQGRGVMVEDRPAATP